LDGGEPVVDSGERVLEDDEVTKVLGTGVLEVLDLLGQHAPPERVVVLGILATAILVVAVVVTITVAVVVTITAFLGLALNQTGWRAAAESLSARLVLVVLVVLVGVGVASGHGRLRVDDRTSADGRRRRLGFG
jgi:hypothetical protein